MNTRRSMIGLLSAATASLLTSCGSIIYPDRVNQKHRGHIDPTIMILDGIGCILFIIPGLIAFAVDFSTGAIYFPEGQGHGDRERTIFDNMSRHQLPPGKVDQKAIEQAVCRHAGVEVDLSRKDVTCVKLDRLEQVESALFQLCRDKLSTPVAWKS
ncbi:MAG TPA: hypothetical protein VIR63_06525 [Pontiella sp.]